MSLVDVWLNGHAASAQLFVSTISGLATFAAVLVAWRTAASTRATVVEMREARLQAVRPVLYLTAKRRSFGVNWKRSEQSFPQLEFFDQKKVHGPPFELRDAVDAPAFDINCHWEIEGLDPLPSDLRLATLQHATKDCDVSYDAGKISFRYADRDSDFLDWDVEYKNEANSTHFELLGKAAKEIDVPAPILNTIIVNALRIIERQQIYRETLPFLSATIAVTVKCLSPAREAIENTFRFRLVLFRGRFAGVDGMRIPEGHLPQDWSDMLVEGLIRPVSEAQAAPNTARKSIIRALYAFVRDRRRFRSAGT